MGELSPEIKTYCEHKTKELIDIICPKRQIVFCTDLNGGLKQIGVTNVQTLPYCLKKAQLNGGDILLMPNPGYYKAYSYENGQLMGQVIENYLKTGTIEIISQTSPTPSCKTRKKNKLEIDQLISCLDADLRTLGLVRYDTKRFQTLPCGLQLTISKDELCIRHIDFNGKQNYVDHEYPLANSIRSVLHNNGFITISAVWLGTKRLKDLGENLNQIANNVVSITSKVIGELRMLSI